MKLLRAKVSFLLRFPVIAGPDLSVIAGTDRQSLSFADMGDNPYFCCSPSYGKGDAAAKRAVKQVEEYMEFSDFEEIVRAEFPNLDEIQMERFRKMEVLYRDWNSKINVISRKDIDALYEHHVLHSLGIGAYLKRDWPEAFRQAADSSASDALSFLDLGTGGGFPGIPLAILLPGAHFTLCDSIGKKLKVASGVAEALGLRNVETVNARAESLDRTFDYVVSRAVTSLEQFYPWVRGKFSRSILYLKGGDINEEVVTLMRKYRLEKGSVHCWKMGTWLRDEYFAEKFVIEIENNYLCSPQCEKYKKLR